VPVTAPYGSWASPISAELVSSAGISLEELALDPAYLSVPRPVEFPTENGQTAHALYYPPANPGFRAPPGERPPLLVTSHGGPTAQVVDRLNLSVQYFTSRGFAVADVDYRGSTGYGRAYRERLNGNWGVADTLDCINAALQLTAKGEADGARLAIRGGSAGGHTTDGAAHGAPGDRGERAGHPRRRGRAARRRPGGGL
jgi:dipeptidyl aminopeptidase/acylaminoacyl peptidase